MFSRVNQGSAKLSRALRFERISRTSSPFLSSSSLKIPCHWFHVMTQSLPLLTKAQQGSPRFTKWYQGLTRAYQSARCGSKA
eukprot:119716-Pyramimonas_sp.AAC.1